MSNSQKHQKFYLSSNFDVPISMDTLQTNINEILHQHSNIELLHALSSSKIIEQLYNTLQCLVNRPKKQAQSNSSLQLSIEILKNSICVIDMMIKCFEQLAENFLHEAAVDIFIDGNNIPVYTLHIIYVSYHHCQSSEKLYEDDFSSVSNLLGEFFQKTFNLQKIFSAILGKSKIASDSTAQEDNYVKVSQLLLDIAIVVKDIDQTLLGTTWKLLISFLVNSKAVLHERKALDLELFVKEIIENGKNFSNQCKAITDENKDEAFTDIDCVKSLIMGIRMTSFFLELFNTLASEYCTFITDDIVHLVVDFSYTVAENLQPILIVIPRNPIHSFPASLKKTVSLYFIKELDRCLAFVCPFQPFRTKLFEKENLVHSNSVAKLIFLLRLLQLASKNQTVSSFFKTNKILDNTLSSLFLLQDPLYSCFIQSAQCYFDDTNPDGSLLSELVSTSLLSCFDVITPDFSLTYETLLTTNIISSNAFSFHLALDVWTHFFRSLVNQKETVSTLIEVISTFNLANLDFRHFQVGSLLKQFYLLLPQPDQLSIHQIYPLKKNKNLQVWFFLAPCFLGLSLDLNEAMNKISSILADMIQSWLDGAGRLDRLPSLINFFRVFDSCLKTIVDTSNTMSRFSKTSFSCKAEVLSLWKSLPISCDDATHSLASLYDVLASVTSAMLFINLFEQSEILTILQSSKAYFISSFESGNDFFLFNFIQILVSLRFTSFSQEVLLEVVSFWREVMNSLANSHWLLRHKCLDGFESFSKSTKHPNTICQICTDSSHPSQPDISSMVKSHLRRDICKMSSEFHFTPPMFNFIQQEEYDNTASRIVKSIKESVEQLYDVSSSLNDHDRTVLKDICFKLQEVFTSF